MRHYVFIDMDIETLRRKIFMPEMRPFLLRLTDLCTVYKKTILEEVHPPRSTTYMGIACINLALAALVTGQRQYLDEARRWMRTLCAYEKWGNAHLVNVDLSASWILFGLSLAWDWLKDDLEPEESEKIRDKIILQADIMFDYYEQTLGHGWATNYWQNHNWINLTGLAAAGYVLQDSCRKGAVWIQKAKENFARVFDGLADDGSDYEGVVYWRYGVPWLFIYAHLLKTEEGFSYFEKSAFLKNTFYYRLYQSVPNLKEIANFGDCHDRKSGHTAALYYKVAAEYGDGHAQYLGDLVTGTFLYGEAYESHVKPGILPEIGLEIIWRNPSVLPRDFSSLPLVKEFKDLGLAVWRSSWAEDALFLAFKSGAPGGRTQWKKLIELYEQKNYHSFGLSHQHPDNNSFIFHAHGAYLAVDEGYNQHMKSSCHNVITVDGKGYPVEDVNNLLGDSFFYNRKTYPDFKAENFAGELDLCLYNGDAALFRGKSAALYDRTLNLRRNDRTVLCYRGYIIILDELDSEDLHSWQWHLQTDNRGEAIPAAADYARAFRYEAGTALMRLWTINRRQLETRQYETLVRALMTSQEPDNFCETLMQTLEFSNKEKAASAYFITVLIPESAAAVGETPELRPIQGDTWIGVELRDNTQSNAVDTFVYRDNGGAEPLCYGKIKTDARWFWIQQRDDKIQNYAAGDARTFTADGEGEFAFPEKQTLLKGSQP